MKEILLYMFRVFMFCTDVNEMDERTYIRLLCGTGFLGRKELERDVTLRGYF